MDAANEIAEGHLSDDIGHAVMRLGRMRVVELGHHDAGCKEEDETKQRDAAENVRNRVGIFGSGIRERMQRYPFAKRAPDFVRKLIPSAEGSAICA